MASPGSQELIAWIALSPVGVMAVLAGVAVFGILFAAAGYNNWRAIRAIKDGIETDGVIEEVDPPVSRPGKSLRYLKVSYCDRDNRKRTAIMSISSRYGGAGHKGDPIKLTYSASRPKWVRHRGMVRDSVRAASSAGAMVMGGVVAAIGLGFLALMVMRSLGSRENSDDQPGQ